MQEQKTKQDAKQEAICLLKAVFSQLCSARYTVCTKRGKGWRGDGGAAYRTLEHKVDIDM